MSDMQDELRDLYQTTILDHNKRPRNFGRLGEPSRFADGHNPLCGDKIHLTLQLGAEGRVTDVAFEGAGCAISTASASLMTEFVKGKTLSEVQKAFDRFHEVVTSSPQEEVDAPDLGKLVVFAGVREYPMRVKCATLAWHTLQAALEGEGATAVTE